MDLNELERQLSNPKGDFGIQLGEVMNNSNKLMVLITINLLELKDQRKSKLGEDVNRKFILTKLMKS